ncbi:MULTISPECIES: nucleoside hydrolase [unclassified Paenibacillus]|uniref:nucleoside hydrolase n=1 Tax=unclassified Paenibacillus TaxID=185978 RepID=UPI00240720C1|nr:MULTISPECIES: nucleoside hydrolase [unclassified Paenibacillus]MDF9842256.1 inosine-uridine nucleoside N-ribohydrolase [Paenibacillus sp. PastF-2]MDF9848867.1 inosine-uridine nucleoside N-ribohydrolase [Paenibacillus sp. PastM-2]MDF9855437.1 inosine-uridine nucleoside N-ribohydrolase [Paenibacillus sp. PastF-1]MDH6480687.1 inosine-uridine nucleoside N-ribohydrolase [Paenibacillus sp. PastH-2]MDH6508132.1 inosine-uridine nucleoside N-ribohydrolase [Paenibacillus sp. PastM-3]
MIIDCDTGIDDALAILYALRTPGVIIEGITMVFGNTSVEQAADNTLRLLDLAKPDYEIPVAIGASKALARELGSFSPHVHGENGIGDVQLPASSLRPVKESAAAFIVRLANEHPGEIVLVTLGRLTNLAQALELDPDLTAKLKKVVVMGGTIFKPGNVTPVAEANLWGDPLAADRVFTSGLPVLMVGLDVTLETLITSEHLELLKRHGKEENRAVIEFMDQSLQHYFHFYREANYIINAAPLHDPLAMMAALHPDLLTCRQMKVRVEHQGEHTSGMVVADLRAQPKVGEFIEVAAQVDARRAVGVFLAAFM